MAAVFGLGLGIWVVFSFSDPERPLRATIEALRLKRAETERRREVNDFLEQYHPALKADQEQISQMHAEACGNLNELQGLRAQLKHENAAAETDIAINRMKETESELAAALHRIDSELEELYAAHELAKIADEGWSPGAVDRMKRIVPEDLAVDYSKYSFVIRASIRKAIVREMDLLERRNPHGIRISRLRKALNERHPIGVNPVSHAVRDLIKAGVLKSLPVNKTRTRHAFRLAYPGRKILSEMNR